MYEFCGPFNGHYRPPILQTVTVSTDEGNDSSKPAQLGFQNSNCFGSTKDLMPFENV